MGNSSIDSTEQNRVVLLWKNITKEILENEL